MADRNEAAGAVLRSEIYRDVRPDADVRPLPARGVPSRAGAPTGARKGPQARKQLRVAGVPSPFTALALLGLLDLFEGG